MKRSVYLVLIGMIFFSLCSCGNSLEKAKAAYAEGEYETVIELCEDITAHNANNGEAWLLCADAYVKQGQQTNALLCYTNAIDCGIYCYTSIAEMYIESGNNTDAIAWLTKQLEHDTEDVETYLCLIDIYESRGMYDEAKELRLLGYEYTSDERLEPTGLSEEEAKELGGLFVLSSGRFQPLQLGGNRMSYFGEDPIKNIVFTDTDMEDVPMLEDGDEIVLFKDGQVEEFYTAIPVQKTGYTCLLSFSRDQRKTFDTGFYVYDTYREYQEVEALAIKDIETINEMSYDTFFKDQIFDSIDFCTNPTESAFGEGCTYIHDEEFFADLEEYESLNIGYHEGTEYVETVLEAKYKYYGYDGCAKETADEETSWEEARAYTGANMPVTLSKEAYAVLDSTDLESGTYIIPIGKERYIIHVE